MASIATSPRAVQHGASHAAGSVWLARLGRVGLGARGMLYVVLAYVAVRVAFGQTNTQSDTQGALHSVARQPFGHILLAGLAVGFGAFALWQLTMAVWGGAPVGPWLLVVIAAGVLAFGVYSLAEAKYADL